MAGSKFQYDESGGTFFYFLTSFLALVLVPASYYWWPKEEKREQERDRNVCHCERCAIKKTYQKQSEPWQRTKRSITRFLILLGWVLLAFFAYKCAHVEHDQVNWDPFEILEIDSGATAAEIKKAYRRMSLIYHPDKGGDSHRFMMISKAYAALTDDEARKNWEKYGNPDGPGATSFGIALPEWIVKKENSFIVLGIYALIFMIALPIAVGIWWYKSIKFGGDQVLLDTSQLYYYFINKTPHMVIKRTIMIIAASFEFERNHNPEVVERPTDNEEMHYLLKELPNLNTNNKERPLCYPYSIKARALLHAHLSRLVLPANSLELDRQFVVSKCPNLIHEFVNCSSQLTMLALAGRMPRCPSLETIEGAMKLSSMIVQCMWESKNPLLQLPHVTEEMLRRFMSKKKVVRSLKEFLELKDDERKAMLRTLTPYQYEDIMTVLNNMPFLDVTFRTEVLDDEDPKTITAGAIVTVFVTLTRKSLTSVVKTDSSPNPADRADEEEDNDENRAPEKSKAPVWSKQAKKGKGGKRKKSSAPLYLKKSSGHSQNKPAIVKSEEQEVTNMPSEDEKVEPQEQEDPEQVSDSDSRSTADDPSQTLDSKDKPDKGSGGDGSATEENQDQDQENDDHEWEKFQKKLSKKDKKALEGKSRISHTVHCPYFPHDKQEYWWVYLSDKKRQSLVTYPYLVTNLVDKEDVELKFTAPPKPGAYGYNICVRSDSYVDFDIIKPIKLDVKEAKKIEHHPQWDISEDEEDENHDDDSAVEDSDLLDESDDGDDDLHATQSDAPASDDN